MTYRSELLAKAQKTVDGDRDKEFGDPLQNMKCAAQLIGGLSWGEAWRQHRGCRCADYDGAV